LLGNLRIWTALSFRASDPFARKMRAAACRRVIPVSRFINAAAARAPAQEFQSIRADEPNETTAAAIREPVEGLSKYRTVADAWRSLKSDAKRRSKKSVPA
jgi:hypothetical protein